MAVFEKLSSSSSSPHNCHFDAGLLTASGEDEVAGEVAAGPKNQIKNPYLMADETFYNFPR